MEERPVTKASGVFWAWVPAGLIASMLAGLGVMAYIAIDDPTFALEPDYYDKAVHWDRGQTLLRASEASGFVLKLRQPLVLSHERPPVIELELRDRSGAAISGARLEVSAFPNAFASRVEHVVMTEVAPGVYRGELQYRMPGLWELRCNVSVGPALYTRSLRTDVIKRGAA